MREISDQPTPDRRATWVALRTLRQRPRVVGHTDSGDPIFEIRSVKLVLGADAPHFDRLVQCSKCGRDVPGPPVLGPADLERPAHSLICADCVRQAAVPSAGKREDRPARSDHPVAQAGVVPEQPPEPVATQVVDDRRLAAIEAQLLATTARLTELAEAQQSQRAERRSVDESTHSWLQGALQQGLARIGANVTTATDAGDARVVALEAQVGQTAGGMAELVAGQRGEMAALAGALAAVRSELERATAANADLARMQGDLDLRLVEMGSRVATERMGVRPGEEVERRVEEAEGRLSQSIDAQRAQLHAALAEGLSDTRAEVRSLEQRLSERVATVSLGEDELARAQQEMSGLLSTLAERLAQDADSHGQLQAVGERLEKLQADLHAEGLRAQSDLAAREQATAGLTTADEQLSQRIEVLAEQAAHAAGIESERLHALEQQVQAAAVVLAGAADSQRVELREVRAALEQQGEQLRAGLEREADRAAADVARVARDQEDLVRAQEDMSGRLAILAEQAAEDDAGTTTERMQSLDERFTAALAYEAKRASAEVARVAQGNEELARAQAEMRARLDGVRLELEAGLNAELLDLRSRIERLAETQEALDAGLGELRAKIAAVGESNTGLAAGWTRPRRSTSASESAAVAKDQAGEQAPTPSPAPKRS